MTRNKRILITPHVCRDGHTVGAFLNFRKQKICWECNRISHKKNYDKRWKVYEDRKHYGGNKETAVARDGGCVRCGITRAEHRVKYGRDISVHHIDGRGTQLPKEQQNNELSNLETLCSSCHSIQETPKRNGGRKHKITMEQARKIRELNGTMKQKDLAAMFGISRGNIYNIVHNNTWKESQ
jgi:5-methylcytosine-specific restriction endonuclease McrA